MLRRLPICLLLAVILALSGCAPVALRLPWGLSRLPWTVLYVDSNQRLIATGSNEALRTGVSHGSVAASPTGAHVAAVDAQGALSIIPVLAGDPVQIDTGLAEPAFWPEVSPWAADGRALVYVARQDLFHYRLGKRPRQLTVSRDAFSPRLSPDGTLVAFGRRTGGDQDLGLWVVPVSGGEPRQLVEATGDIFGACCPTWSPDQQWVAFLQAYEGGAVGVAKADGSDTRVGIEAAWTPLHWSPDSATLVFPKVYYGESGDGLWRYGLAESQAQLLAGKGQTALPAYAPDDTRAVVALAARTPAGQETRTRLLAYSLPGWEKSGEELTLPGHIMRASFAPDGGQLAVLAVTANGEQALHLGSAQLKTLQKRAVAEDLVGWVRRPANR